MGAAPVSGPAPALLARGEEVVRLVDWHQSGRGRAGGGWGVDWGAQHSPTSPHPPPAHTTGTHHTTIASADNQLVNLVCCNKSNPYQSAHRPQM